MRRWDGNLIYTLRVCVAGSVAALTLAAACDARPNPRADTTTTVATHAVTVPRSTAESSILVTDDSVGSLPLLSRRSELSRYLRIVRDTTEAAEEDMTNQIVVGVLGVDTVRVVVDEEGKVYWYILRSPRFRTRDSLGVSTSLGQLVTIPGVYAKSHESQSWIKVPRHCGLSFTMENDLGLDSPDSVGVARLSQMPKGTRVSEVAVYGCRKEDTHTVTPPM